MTINEFVEKFDAVYQQDYEYEWYEDLRQIILLVNKKLDIDFECIKIDLSDNLDRYSIYREFLYEDCYSQVTTLAISKTEMIFCECIRRITGQAAQISFEDGMGCPFCSDLVGYFDCAFYWDDLTRALNLIEQACQQMATLSIEDIDKNSKAYSLYKEQQFKLFEQLRDFAPDICSMRVEDSTLNKEHSLDSVCAYVNESKTILTGIGLEFLEQLRGTHSTEKYYFYSGIQYSIISSVGINNKTAIIDKRLIDKVIELFVQVDEEWDIAYVQYSLDEQSWPIITYGELWATICPIKPEHHETCFTYEKNIIKNLEHDFMTVAPEKLWNRTYNFSVLSDEYFEFLCRDLLVAMSFSNIQIRGKSHAPDGGVDITAEEEYKTLIGTEKRLWIFQCKHMKEQVGRKDLSEVRDLLQEFHADCYGLFYSGYFSPNTLDRIENICKNDHIVIKGWDHNGLEILLTKFPAVSIKHFGL